MIIGHDEARQMINANDARITGTVNDNGERYYALDNLAEQRTDHAAVGDNLFDEYVRFFGLLPEEAL
jgi:hypothetical protein